MDAARPEYVCPLCDARSLTAPSGRTGLERAIVLIRAGREALRDDDREAIQLTTALIDWLEARAGRADPTLPLEH